MKRDIQAVFFDAGYTLLCMDPEQTTIFLNVCEELEISIDRERLAHAVARANAFFAPRPTRTSPLPFSQAAVDRFWTEYNRLLLQECAADPGHARHAEVVYRRFTAAIRWRIYDDVHGVLRELRRRGTRLGVISNWTGDLEEILQKIELHRQFDFVIDSSRFGYEKPHAEIFQEAVRRAGVPASASLHVGDSPDHDVEGALNSGLRALLLDRHDRHPAFTRAPRIATLAAVLEHVVEAPASRLAER